jgi:hypothetical protein
LWFRVLFGERNDGDRGVQKMVAACLEPWALFRLVQSIARSARVSSDADNVINPCGPDDEDFTGGATGFRATVILVHLQHGTAKRRLDSLVTWALSVMYLRPCEV